MTTPASQNSLKESTVTASTPAEPTCGFPKRPGPAGHVPSCQLCPRSPTYWRGGPGEGSTDDGTVCRWTPTASSAAKQG